VVPLLKFLDRGEFVGGEIGLLRLDNSDLRLLLFGHAHFLRAR
jgi:hypothetical protein